MSKLYTPFKPHKPVVIEGTLNEFIVSCGGDLVSSLVGPSPGFENADYVFERDQVIIELKSIETDWPMDATFGREIKDLWLRFQLLGKVSNEDLETGRDVPGEVRRPFLNLLKKPLKRILKKANRQIRQTRARLGRDHDSGLVLVVIDGMLTVSPKYIIGLISEILIHDYSSISAFVVLTVNEYVSLQGDDVARLLWVPTYHEAAPNSLVDFVDELGRKWFAFLELKVGAFGDYAETEDRSVLERSSFISGPKRNRRIIT